MNWRLILRLLIFSMPVFALLAVPLAARNVGEKRAVDVITSYLLKPLDANGLPVKPDSASIKTIKTGSRQVYFSFSTTFPFNDIGITLQVNREDSSYIWEDQIQDVDGAGGLGQYQTTITLYGDLDAAETPLEYDVKTNSVEAIDALLVTNVDTPISSRLAPTDAGRTLDISALGQAGIDLDNTIGELGAAEFTTNAFTTAKFADGFLTGAKIGAGAITPTQAPNLDVAVSTRLAPGGTLAAVTNVAQLGGSAAGVNGLNGMFDANENYVSAELNVLGNLGGSVQGTVKLGANGTDADSSFWLVQNRITAIESGIATNLDVPISSRVAPTVPGRTLDISAGGAAGADFSNIEGTLDAAEIGTNAITDTKIAAGSITSSEAPNLDQPISSRLAPSGTLATVTNVTQLGGTNVGINGLNEGFDGDAVFATPEFNMILATNGTANDTRITTIINSLNTSISATDSLEAWVQMIMYVAGSCDGCSTKYLPDDGTGYKDGYEVYFGGAKKATVTFFHNNNPAVLDARKARKD